MELVRRGLASSRAHAAQLVDNGSVLVGGSVAERSARLVGPGEPVSVTAPPGRYVSRGGEKLAAALERFDVHTAGVIALDAGASTGGFTDCLLQHGAASVVALDVGRAQLHERLRSDPRVRVVERTNIRFVDPSSLGNRFDLVVADLSFISLRTVAGRLVGLTLPGGDLVVLVKPQFEAGRRAVSKGRGVVRDPEVWADATRGVIIAFETAGAVMMGAMVSPLRGADGNVEFLVHMKTTSDFTPSGAIAPDGSSQREEAISEAVGAAQWL